MSQRAGSTIRRRFCTYFTLHFTTGHPVPTLSS
jgi:hypothetical protein